MNQTEGSHQDLQDLIQLYLTHLSKQEVEDASVEWVLKELNHQQFNVNIKD